MGPAKAGTESSATSVERGCFMGAHDAPLAAGAQSPQGACASGRHRRYPEALRRGLKMRGLGVWVVCAGLLACNEKSHQVSEAVPDAGPAAVAEHEPNDRPEQALAISTSTLVSASLSSDPAKGDEDWYQLSAAT